MRKILIGLLGYPSVDVSYSDAATGAKQIKLLGLSGTYVQMLTENVPNLRGAALPYSLGYVPGPWMQSIQVSKGASSVKNGYAQLMFETDITEHHNLSVGASLNHDYYDELFNPLGALARAESTVSEETTTGVYAKDT